MDRREPAASADAVKASALAAQRGVEMPLRRPKPENEGGLAFLAAIVVLGIATCVVVIWRSM
jgi:hypothetical protein